MRQVKVVPYDSIWQHLYLDEAKKLRDVLKEQCLETYHIGSTAVPGLAAKPIIDIMIVARSIEEIDSYNQEMAVLGYEACGENGIPGRRYFQKGGEQRTHHVHVYQEGDENIIRHLAFRDYLRTFSGEMERYSHLKRELAKLYPFDVDSYIEGKSIFVQVMEIKALNWYNTRAHEENNMMSS